MLRLIALEVAATLVVGVLVLGGLWWFEVWPMVPLAPEIATETTAVGAALGVLVALFGILLGLIIDEWMRT